MIVQQSDGFPDPGEKDEPLKVVHISHLLIDGSIPIKKDSPVSHAFSTQLKVSDSESGVRPLTQFKPVRRRKPQIGMMGDPISHIKIEAPPSFNLLIHPFRKVGMTQDNDLKSFQKFLVRKEPEGLSHPLGVPVVIDLVALAIQSLGYPTAPVGADESDQTVSPPVLNHPPVESIFPLLRIRQVPMGHKRPLSPQTLLPSVRVDPYLYFKPLLEKRIEREIMVSFDIGDMNTLMGKSLEGFENGKVFRKRERAWRQTVIGSSGRFKPEEELEEVSQDHKMSHPLLLRIQELKEQRHLLRFPPGKMGIRDEDPILFGTNQSLSFTSPHRNSQILTVPFDPDRKHFADR
jgi:hypothetical protein